MTNSWDLLVTGWTPLPSRYFADSARRAQDGHSCITDILASFYTVGGTDNMSSIFLSQSMVSQFLFFYSYFYITAVS